MSQNIWDTIIPSTTSGNQLADLLNEFKDAVVSGFSGTTRPANLQTYGYWVDTTNIGSGYFSMKIYDGTTDIEMFQLNTTTGNIVLGDADSSISIVKKTDDSIGPVLEMDKSRILGGGQTLISDILGDYDWIGRDGSDVPYVSARMRVVSVDDVTAAEHGSYISILTTATDGSALVEAIRITPEGKIGFGTNTPGKELHVSGTDSTAGIKATIVEDSTTPVSMVLNKKRSTGNGQVLNLDDIGNVSFTSTDQNGAEIEVAKIEVTATEDHTDTDQGVDFIISTKQNGATAYDEAIKISGGVVELFGETVSDSSLNLSMAHGGVDQDLFTMDGTVYGGFIAEILATGRDDSVTRQQVTTIKGVYDFNNTSWKYDHTNDILNGTDKLIDIVYTDAATLDVDYSCELTQGTFVDGKLYVKIRRFPR